MTSWRELAPEPVQDDVDLLATTALTMAEQLLALQGGFLPFAKILGVDGELSTVTIEVDEADADDVDPASVFAGLVELVASYAETLRGAAFASDVLFDEADAVRVEIEHREGVAVQAVAPYVVQPAVDDAISSGLVQDDQTPYEVTVGDLATGASAGHVWTSSATSGD